MDFSTLRKEHPIFEYNGVDITDCGESFHVVYRFSLPKLCEFAPSWDFPKPANAGLDEVLSEMFFSLGMVELISYWKCVCSPTVKICAGMSKDRIEWWKKLYFNGLGEFFYVNSIDADPGSFMTIEPCDDCDKALSGMVREGKGYLVPIGGGKDSAVTLELLKKTTRDISAFIVNPRGATDGTCRVAGIDEIHTVKRTLDRRIVELNSLGYLNGHTPFSAILAFSSLITAYLYGKKYIALSNESSANEATVASGANHQYSKSFEFEKDFRDYEKKYIGSGIEYFSLLRPLSEYQIAKLFASYTQYHAVFRSCNVGSKTDSWCGKCPKCLFVAVMLSAFLEKEQISSIFGRDILNDESLRPTLDKLVGDAPEKPFECVGSRSEVAFALQRAAERFGDDAPALIKYYISSHESTDTDDFDNYFDSQNALPFLLECTVASSVMEFNSYIRAVLSGKRVALLGYGREGRSSSALLDSVGIPYTVVDAHDTGIAGGIYGKDYQSSLDSFDIVIKSPGVVLEKDISEYHCVFTSQMELFLEKYRRNIIGVTGTKGKSTTSSLIYHALKYNGIDAVIAGNIGVPVFDAAHEAGKDTVFVTEMSSHQLEYTSVSPHTALYLNLHEEHLDHYGTFEKYRIAKENIFRHSADGDLLISGCELGLDVPSLTVGYDCGDIRVGTDSIEGFGRVIKVTPENANLVGRHGLCDIAFAWAVCSQYIDDEHFLSSLGSFVPLAHRLQRIGTFGGAIYYDDSISTIGDTTINALKALPDTDTVIIGGMDRGIDYGNLIDYLAESNVPHILLMEESGKRIYDTAIKLRPNTFDNRMKFVGNLDNAVKVAKELTENGRMCVLSPAAASYGIFRNFEERGEYFAKLVKEL